MATKLPDITTDFAQWYHEVVFQAELADQAPVRGCMVIRPYGYAIWEQMQKVLDAKIKATGHQAASFPLLIPYSFLQKEAEHVEGFAPEVAVVTHAGGKELEEPLVVRPTSETMIHYMYARWLKSWRDLPIKIYQWANIVRWEMRTRPFLRTTEFLWHEGHTVHETREQAVAEVEMMLEVYREFIETYLAIPTVAAPKPDSDRFAGADITMALESLMPDGKSLQMGTSHLISQNFAKAFNMMFQDRNGQMAYPFLTSWGATTRLIGGLIMTHGDAKGLILPPKIAPIQIAIVPIITQSGSEGVLDKAREIAVQLGEKFRVTLDEDDQATPGAKFYKWELKGVPVRIEIGPRDLAQNKVTVVDRLGLKKETYSFDGLQEYVGKRLEEVQQALFARATERRQKLWFKKEKLADFTKDLEATGGFFQTGWCRSAECEQQLKEYKASIRSVLKEQSCKKCFVCDNASSSDVLIAKSY